MYEIPSTCCGCREWNELVYFDRYLFKVPQTMKTRYDTRRTVDLLVKLKNYNFFKLLNLISIRIKRGKTLMLQIPVK